MKLNETRRGKLEAEFLTAGKAYRAIFWPTPDFNEKTLQRGPSSEDPQCLMAKVSKKQNNYMERIQREYFYDFLKQNFIWKELEWKGSSVICKFWKLLFQSLTRWHKSKSYKNNNNKNDNKQAHKKDLFQIGVFGLNDRTNHPKTCRKR